MVITLNDKTKLDIMYIGLSDDANNLVISLSGDFANAKEIFKNTEKTSVITTDNAEYCGYTILKSISACNDGVSDKDEIRVELEYNGLSKEVDRLKSEIENLQSGILELTDLLLESGEKAE